MRKTAKAPHGASSGLARLGTTQSALSDIARATMRAAATNDDGPPDAYHAYIASRDWINNPVRLAELQAARYRCRLCNRAPPTVRLEVHHRTYKNLGFEQAEDLTTLCATCHGVVTDMLRDRRRLPAPAHADPKLADR